MSDDDVTERKGPPEWRPATPEAAWWGSRSPEQLDILESGEREFYPDVLERRRTKSGDKLHVQVLLRVPRTFERVKARADALRLVSEHAGQKVQTIDAAVALTGQAHWDSVDMLCLLSQSVFDLPQGGKAPRRHALPHLLDAWYSTPSLYAVFARLDYWATHEDPRVTALTDGEMLALAMAVSKARERDRPDGGSCIPLAGTAGHALESFIIFMAKRLVTSPTLSASSP